jgi:NAD(P)-dependent dehydrogenase (short-subunit alcohol dehydrogenase family)
MAALQMSVDGFIEGPNGELDWVETWEDPFDLLPQIDTFSRILAGELGLSGIRVICLRPDAIPEAVITSHTREVFTGFAERIGTTVEAMLTERARTGTLLKRLPTLAEVANFAAFVASDRAGAMTGAIANLTCGSIVDQC